MASIVLEIEAERDCPIFHALHWEMLELLEFWPESLPKPVSLAVHRIVSAPSPIERPVPQNRVLFVASRNPDGRDIPFRQVSYPATHALHRLRKDDGIDVALMIVRPGTFKALEKCLASYPPGHFDLLHIDVHGTLEEDGRRPYLHFYNANDPEPHLVNSDELGHLLKRYHVPAVVTNACQSGKTTVDPGFNFVQGLLQYGVQDAAAMSFAISSSGARIFVEAFYHLLFAPSRTAVSFQDAVHLARKSMARQAFREARFDTKVEVADFFVPIAFSSQGASQETIRGEGGGSEKATGKEGASPGVLDLLTSKFLDFLPSKYVKERGLPDLSGREEEIQELEGSFLPLFQDAENPTNILLVTGMTGVGKSSFAEHLCWWWANTGVVDHVILFSINPSIVRSRVPVILKSLQSSLDVGSYDEVIMTLRSRRIAVLLGHVNHITQWSKVEEPNHPLLNDFLSAVNGGRSLICMTSTSKEDWIRAKVHRFQLGGLNDLDTSSKIIRDRLPDPGSPEEAKEASRDLEKVVDLASKNPAALQIMALGLERLNKEALKTHYHYVRRGITDEMARLYSQNLSSFLSSRSMYRVKLFLEDKLGEPEDGGCLYLCLAVNIGVVRKDWVRADRFTAVSDNEVDHDKFMQGFALVLDRLKNLGLIGDSKNPDYYAISPLFTYAMRIKYQNCTLGSLKAMTAMKRFAKQYYLDRIFDNRMMNFNIVPFQKSMDLLEMDATNYLNLFDDMLEEEVDTGAKVMGGLTELAEFQERFDQLQTVLEGGQVEDDTVLVEELLQLFMEQGTSNEAGLFRILQLFMMQTINTAKAPLTEETIDMCGRYLDRLGVSVSIGDVDIPEVPLNFCVPVITILGWLAQYHLTADITKAQRHVDLGILLCENAMSRLDGLAYLTYYLFGAQLQLLKALAFQLAGDEGLARQLYSGIAYLNVPEDGLSDSIRGFIRSFVALLHVNALHALYNLALGSKGSEASEPERLAVDAAFAELEEALGRRPGDQLDDEEEPDIESFTRGIIGMWDMQGVAKTLKFQKRMRGMSRTTYLSEHGSFWAATKISKINEKAAEQNKEESVEYVKRYLQVEFEKSLETGDMGAAEEFHEELMDLYVGEKKWKAAHRQLVNIKKRCAERPPDLIQGLRAVTETHEERIAKGLRDGMCYLVGEGVVAASKAFFNCLVDCREVRNVLNHDGTDTRAQMRLIRNMAAKGINIKGPESLDAESSLQQIVSLVTLAQSGERQRFKTQLAAITLKDVGTEPGTDEEIVEMIVVALDAYYQWGGLTEEDFISAIRVTVRNCQSLGFLL